MENSNSRCKLLCVMLTGAAIGGALGILFAPDKGYRTRRNIANRAEDFNDTIKDKSDDLLKAIKKEVDMVIGKANEFIENGKARMDQ